MEQGGDQFHPHSLAEREVPHGLADQLADFEERGQFIEPALKLCGFKTVNLPMERKRFLRREVPPELIFLSHDQCESLAISDFTLPRDVSEHRRRSARGINQPRE